MAVVLHCTNSKDKVGSRNACTKGHYHQSRQVACDRQVKRLGITDDIVADLSAQSLISLHLLSHYPKDQIIGEEDTSELRGNASLRSKVVDLVNSNFTGEGWGEAKSWTEDE